MAQLIVGGIISPFILFISKKYEDYSENLDKNGELKDMSLHEFMNIYFSYGAECVFTFGDVKESCNNSLIYLIGYAMSLFTL